MTFGCSARTRSAARSTDCSALSRIACVSSVPPLAVSTYVQASIDGECATRTMCSTAPSRSATSTAASTARIAASESSMPTTTSCPRPGRDGIRRRTEQPGQDASTPAAADDDHGGVLRHLDELGGGAAEPVLRRHLGGVERGTGADRTLVDDRLGGVLERGLDLGEVHRRERGGGGQVDVVHQGQVLALLPSRLRGPLEREL